ncbi:TonB family protein [Adhaeribacter swui]|uniref:TonB family protein n=1 Tax=Adhaeribacter swui TaxID=2086471 RepID=A0A7G7G5W1_9BACT|nr:energy transducer TonB [Adhaeribacter swui]QNF32545.1 TonB family protein [Adhaeribacter swui]
MIRLIHILFICIGLSSLVQAQVLTDSLYLDENFVKTPSKSRAEYLRYTVFNTPAEEEGIVKTFYITGEKYSEYPIQNKTLKATGYNRQWHKNGQLKCEQQIENNLQVGDLKEWYDNGQLYYIYKDHGSQAEALTFYPNGARKRVENFEVGKPVQGRCFTQTGQDTTFYPHEQVPIFPGGLENLYKYLSKNIKYPKAAYKQKAQGNVILQFIVTKTGQIKNIEVVKPLHPDLDNESVRVTASMPIWKPGTIEGIPANVRYTLPIRFKL